MTDLVIRTTVDGQNYDLDFATVTAIDAKDFRREVGQTLGSVISSGKVEADLDLVAGLVWLVRRKAEPGLSYADVAAAITYGSDIDFGEEGEADPEA